MNNLNNLVSKPNFTPRFNKASSKFYNEFNTFFNLEQSQYFTINEISRNYLDNKIHALLTCLSKINSKHVNYITFVSDYTNQPKYMPLHEVLGYNKFCFFKNNDTIAQILITRLHHMVNNLLNTQYDLKNINKFRIAMKDLVIMFYNGGYRNFARLNFSSLDFSNQKFDGCDFYGTAFNKANLNFMQANNCDFSLAGFYCTALDGVIIKNSKLYIARFDSRLAFNEITVLFPQIKDENVWFMNPSPKGINKELIYSFIYSTSEKHLKELNLFYLNKNEIITSTCEPIDLRCPISLEHVNFENACVVKYPTVSGSKYLIKIYDVNYFWKYVKMGKKISELEICPFSTPLKDLEFLPFHVFLQLIQYDK